MINYQTDFYGWTQEQASLLKAGRLSELDRENLIEEVEIMGRSEKRELKSRLQVLLVNLLKWQYQPVARERNDELIISVQRDEFLEILEDNPSLKPQINNILTKSYFKAKKQTAIEIYLNKNTFPDTCPWNLSQILDDNFYPDEGK